MSKTSSKHAMSLEKLAADAMLLTELLAKVSWVLLLLFMKIKTKVQSLLSSGGGKTMQRTMSGHTRCTCFAF